MSVISKLIKLYLKMSVSSSVSSLKWEGLLEGFVISERDKTALKERPKREEERVSPSLPR